MVSLARTPPNNGGNEPSLPPENPEINPKTLAASFTTLLALGGLLFAIGTSEPGTFVTNKAHKKLLYIVGFSLGVIFYGLVFLSARLKYPLYIWAALSVTWVTFWFGVNQDVHHKNDFIKMVLIINSILAALFFLKTLFHVGMSESLQFLKNNLFFGVQQKVFSASSRKLSHGLAFSRWLRKPFGT
ncbi:hypothetical protein C1H46_036466 [Malus baccata]|uniref:Uncharacterized protein n=1 Tax=Malus baccata TaxID=106549 RepID=A0A540KUM9_MALBA|nr:hypothetical protein C1H46_036466 [Malus baccata]